MPLRSLAPLILVACNVSLDPVENYFDDAPTLEVGVGWAPGEGEAATKAACEEWLPYLSPEHRCVVLPSGSGARIVVDRAIDQDVGLHWTKRRLTVTAPKDEPLAPMIGMVSHGLIRALGVSGQAHCGVTSNDGPPDCWSGVTSVDVALCREDGVCR